MGSLGCPLCCKQEFFSVIALHDHLLYYVYRPLQCSICSTHVGGIQEFTRHLARHLSDLSADIPTTQTGSSNEHKVKQSHITPAAVNASRQSCNHEKGMPFLFYQYRIFCRELVVLSLDILV